jgi:hypothetical protein
VDLGDDVHKKCIEERERERMTEIVHMRGLLEELRRVGETRTARTGMEDLNYLGDVHRLRWNAMLGYKYIIPLTIYVGGPDFGEKTTMWWEEGGSLERTVTGKRHRDVWSELKDDEGEVYYITCRPAPKLSDIVVLQREIESNPESERGLILTCKNHIDWRDD